MVVVKGVAGRKHVHPSRDVVVVLSDSSESSLRAQLRRGASAIPYRRTGSTLKSSFSLIPHRLNSIESIVSVT